MKTTNETKPLGRPLGIPAAGTGVHPNIKSIGTKYFLVTVPWAEDWLKHNVKNRSLKEDTVNGFARDAQAGDWEITHQGIAFNDANELIDGQHRLEAIVRSQTPVWLMVTWGLPRRREGRETSPMDAIDRGIGRSIADVLKLQHGIVHPALVVSAATTIGKLCYQKRLRKASISQIITILKDYRPHIETMVRMKSDMRELAGGHLIGALAFARAVNDKAVDEFYQMVKIAKAGNIHNLPANHPAVQLRSFLTGTESWMLSRGSDLSRVQMAEVILAALDLYICKRTVPKLELDKGSTQYFRSKQAAMVEKIRKLFDLPMFYRGTLQAATGKAETSNAEHRTPNVQRGTTKPAPPVKLSRQEEAYRRLREEIKTPGVEEVEPS